jgi:hypothetical protein
LITEKDLQDAIDSCLRQEDPNAQTCIKLAAFYTIKQQLYPDEKPLPVLQSFSAAKPQAVEYDSDTEFGKAVKGKPPEKVYAAFDELLHVIELLQPRLYRNVIQSLYSD